MNAFHWTRLWFQTLTDDHIRELYEKSGMLDHTAVALEQFDLSDSTTAATFQTFLTHQMFSKKVPYTHARAHAPTQSKTTYDAQVVVPAIQGEKDASS